jgi:hypothetical protein
MRQHEAWTFVVESLKYSEVATSYKTKPDPDEYMQEFRECYEDS